jgi:hypothetical protein
MFVARPINILHSENRIAGCVISTLLTDIDYERQYSLSRYVMNNPIWYPISLSKNRTLTGYSFTAHIDPFTAPIDQFTAHSDPCRFP